MSIIYLSLSRNSLFFIMHYYAIMSIDHIMIFLTIIDLYSYD